MSKDKEVIKEIWTPPRKSCRVTTLGEGMCRPNRPIYYQTKRSKETHSMVYNHD